MTATLRSGLGCAIIFLSLVAVLLPPPASAAANNRRQRRAAANIRPHPNLPAVPDAAAAREPVENRRQL